MFGFGTKMLYFCTRVQVSPEPVVLMRLLSVESDAKLQGAKE